MDDYHEFKRTHEIQTKKWWLYWSPNYVSNINRIMAPKVQRQPLTLIQQMEAKVPMVLEPLEVMELSGLWCKGMH